VLQVETLYEVGGALAGIQVAWAYSTGSGSLTVDQAAALVVAVVVVIRIMTMAVRRYWQLHHVLQPDAEFPPDRWVVFPLIWLSLWIIISDHATLPRCWVMRKA